MSLLPLDDITVLDLSHALAGPFASTMLGDFGARIIKIEPPTGDIARAWGPPFYGSEPSYVVGLHRNKQSVVIDFKHAEGKELFFKLVERADVVLENYRVGVIDKLGLGYEAARARNPRIIYCSVSGFGQTGPYRDRAALDLILQAESGMMSVTGEEGGRGVRAGVSIADMTAGMYAAYGIMTALHARARTGRGQQVDVSMLEGQLSLLQTMVCAYLGDGQVPKPMGTAYKALLPYQTFRTKTQDLALAVGSEKLWKDFCPLIGAPDMTNDARWHNNAARGKNRESLIARLQEIFLTKSYEEWEAILVPAGIPMGAINPIDRVVEHPQVKARNVLVECEHPTAGKVKVVAPPVRLSETPGNVRSPAPLLGQHTDAVLRDRLGLDDGEIERLRRLGALGATTGP
jgi:crotonobetainyl-CoA:carnitine CoA-transferase CaiB-like acyl-CoA transferase